MTALHMKRPGGRRALPALAAASVALLIALPIMASAAPEPERTQALAYLPGASDALDRRGFVHVINHSDADGEVRIEAIDDERTAYGPVMLSFGAGSDA